MSTSLLKMSLDCKRDLVQARQRGRQLAGLLRFEGPDQLLVAAASFEIAWTAFHQQRHSQLCFEIDNGTLKVFGVCRPSRNKKEPERPLGELRLEKPLPAGDHPLAADDLAWVAAELARHTPLNAFEELHQQNREMLRLLHGLMAEQPKPAKQDPSAA